MLDLLQRYSKLAPGDGVICCCSLHSPNRPANKTAMLVSISRQQPAADCVISDTMVQGGAAHAHIVRASERQPTTKSVQRTIEAVSASFNATTNMSRIMNGKQLPEQFTLCSITAKSASSSTQSSSDHTLRASGDVHTQHSVATSIASYVSCAPTLTRSPSTSPKPRRSRRTSTASSQGSDHYAPDATVRSSIGHSDDEDEPTIGSQKQLHRPTNTANATASAQSADNLGANKTDRLLSQKLSNGVASQRSLQKQASAGDRSDRPSPANVRRTHSLTSETRRKVVSMHMPSSFSLAPSAGPSSNPVLVQMPTPVSALAAVDSDANATKRAEQRPGPFGSPRSVASTPDTASQSNSSSAASSKSEENRSEVDQSTAKITATVASSKQSSVQRKVVPSVSNVIPIKQPANRVLPPSAAALASSPPVFNEETSRSLASGSKILSELENRVKASSHERLAGSTATVVTAQQQPSNDKLLLPDKHMFLKKSQWSSESTLNIIQSPAQNPPVQNTPKAMPPALTNVNAAHGKRLVKTGSPEDVDASWDESHVSVNGAGPLPMKVSHVQQPLKFDKPSQIDPSSRTPSLSSLASKHSRSRQQQYQAVYVTSPLQYQPSASSTLTTTTATNFDDTDIDVEWDDLSGVASEGSFGGLLKSQNIPKSTQSTTQHELIGVVEAYEMYLGELDVIMQKERQQFEQVRAGVISVECWRETAKNILQFKVVAVEQMRKLLD